MRQLPSPGKSTRNPPATNFTFAPMAKPPEAPHAVLNPGEPMYPMKKPLVSAVAFSLMCLCGSRAMGQESPGAITVTEGEVTMPTYEHSGRELQPPLFADSAV